MADPQPYKIVSTDNDGNPMVILRIADDANIPAEPLNRDYREFLDWIAKGNAPDPKE